MNAEQIAEALGGHRSGKGFVCKCPLPSHGRGRGDRTPSLSLCDGENGKLLVICHGGCDTRDILAELRGRGLLQGNRDKGRPQRNNPFKPEPIVPDPGAVDLWRSAIPVEGTLAERYLQGRKINLTPKSLRFLPEHQLGERIVPAMIAAVQAGDRRVVAAQLTFLDPRTGGKMKLKKPRWNVGKLFDGAVRLATVDDVLGFAEGVETGLSAMQLFDVPVWCALGTRMDAVSIPPTVREIHVFRDNGVAGELAAKRVLEKYPDLKIFVRRPPEGYSDFNDVAQALELVE